MGETAVFPHFIGRFFMKFDSILFDLDGTLWDATAQVAEAWNEVIAGEREQLAPYGKGQALTAADVRALCGKIMDDITDLLFGDYPGKQALAERCYLHENNYLAGSPGVVYPGVPDVLAALSAKLPLYIVSNCQTGYIETFLEGTGLSRYFSGHLSFGETQRPKGDNIRLLCQREGLRAPVYVGDTQSDADAAAAAGVPFVHARYGFGEVQHCDLSIAAPEDLLPLV